MRALPAIAKQRANRLQGSIMLPGEDVVINPNHWLSAGLAFLFVPTPTGFRDLVRGDLMTFTGTVTPSNSPFGPSWIFGSTAGGVQGFASTAGGDAYYNPPTVNRTLACGAWNPVAIASITDAYFAMWSDATYNNGIVLDLRVEVGVPRAEANVNIGGTSGRVEASGGAGVTMQSVSQGMTYSGSYDGSTITGAYSSTSLGPGSGTAAFSHVSPTGVDRVVLSGLTSALSANRCILWAAGWFTIVPLVQLQWLTKFNGGLPPGLLIPASPRTYSFPPLAVSKGRPHIRRANLIF